MAGLGRKVWAADEILSAEDLQDYIQDQVVFVFDSAGARTSGILSPTEGMMSYLKDTNQISVFNGSAWVDIAPDVGTPGTYTKVTTDFKGRVTSGTTLSASDVPLLNDASIPTLAISKTSGLQSALDSKMSASTGTHTGLMTLIAGAGGAITANGQIFTSGIFRSTSDCWVDGTLQGGAVSVSGNITGANTYNQTNTGRAMFVNSAGLYGIGSSSRRFKENIVDAEIDTDAVLKIAVRNFTYKKDFDPDDSVQIGVIAEELEDLGLDQFLFYNEDGLVDGVAYEKLALALIPLVQEQQSRLDALEARLDKLEK